MSKVKTISFNTLKKTNDGVILISMSLGIFVIISIFTFFLMKLVVKENNMSLYHALDIKTRNLAHSAMGRGIFQFGNLRNITSQTGNLNNGNYAISYDGVADEIGDPLPYSHYTMLKSVIPKEKPDYFFLHFQADSIQHFMVKIYPTNLLMAVL